MSQKFAFLFHSSSFHSAFVHCIHSLLVYNFIALFVSHFLSGFVSVLFLPCSLCSRYFPISHRTHLNQTRTNDNQKRTTTPQGLWSFSLYLYLCFSLIHIAALAYLLLCNFTFYFLCSHRTMDYVFIFQSLEIKKWNLKYKQRLKAHWVWRAKQECYVDYLCLCWRLGDWQSVVIVLVQFYLYVSFSIEWFDDALSK